MIIRDIHGEYFLLCDLKAPRVLSPVHEGGFYGGSKINP